MILMITSTKENIRMESEKGRVSSRLMMGSCTQEGGRIIKCMEEVERSSVMESVSWSITKMDTE